MIHLFIGEIPSEFGEDASQFICFDVSITIVIEASKSFEDFCTGKFLKIEVSDYFNELIEFNST